MANIKRRKAPGTENPYEEYEMMRHRADSDRIRKALEGQRAPTREQVIEKLNRRRKENG